MEERPMCRRCCMLALLFALIVGIHLSHHAYAETVAAGSYAGGSGTSGDPYQISNLAELRRLSETVGDWQLKHFELTNNIDASDPFQYVPFSMTEHIR